jgi:hypothetical protein
LSKNINSPITTLLDKALIYIHKSHTKTNKDLAWSLSQKPKSQEQLLHKNKQRQADGAFTEAAFRG